MPVAAENNLGAVSASGEMAFTGFIGRAALKLSG
jgi:hypothetical protein